LIPVAVSVPAGTPLEISMEVDKWAFGKITGKPR
jgi:hypothetical protein